MSTTTILYRDIAPGAIDGAQITATEATPFSDPSMLADDEHYVSQAATLERNVWTLDGTRRIYGGGTEPYWSSVLSGDDCTLDPAPVVTLTLDGTYTSPGITLVFDTSSSGGYCSDVLICWYRSGALLTEKQQTYFDLYYNQDLSLAEIAEQEGISRQGVHDAISRSEALLASFERVTGCVAREQKLRHALAAITAEAQPLLQAEDPATRQGAQRILAAVDSLKE